MITQQRSLYLKKEFRQADPLAHSLYLVPVEHLAGAVRQTKKKNIMNSVKVGSIEVKVNMLQYVSNTLSSFVVQQHKTSWL